MQNPARALILIFSLPFAAASQNLYFPSPSGTWDTLSPASLGWCPEKLDSLHDYLKEKSSKAFIILKDGKIAVEWYFGQFTPDSLWYWASAGKGVTSLLTGIAQQEGFLNLSDQTSSWLGSGWTTCDSLSEQQITVQHQLTMSSALDDGVPDNHCTHDTCLQCLDTAGTRWAYHNAPYTLLHDVLQSATGTTVNNYYATRVGNKINAGGTFYTIGYDHVFVSIPRDMARFGLLMLARGTWDGTPVLTDTVYFNEMISTSQNLNKSYGYLWWLNGKGEHMLPGSQYVFAYDLIPNAPDDMYAALGKNDQKIYVVPSQNLVIIRMGEAAGPPVPTLSGFDNELWEKINELPCASQVLTLRAPKPADIIVFPNPASDHLAISAPEDMITQVRVLNILGKPIISSKSLSVDVSTLPNGTYLLEITGQQVFSVKQISLNR